MFDKNDNGTLYSIALEAALKLFSQCYSMEEVLKVCNMVQDILKQGYEEKEAIDSR
jgi:hypothetical protein